jgi:hypothetical protein
MSAKKATQATVAKKKAAPAVTKKGSDKKSAKTAAPVAGQAVEKAKKALAVAKNAKEKEKKASKQAPVIVATGPMAQKWTALFKKADAIESKPYNMKAAFNEKTAIVHKVLGWGYILANRNDRLEVLFKDGIKYLISNYK